MGMLRAGGGESSGDVAKVEIGARHVKFARSLAGPARERLFHR